MGLKSDQIEIEKNEVEMYRNETLYILFLHKKYMITVCLK